MARSVSNLSRQTGGQTPMQITSVEEAREIIGLEGDLPDAEIIEPPEEDEPTGGGSESDEDEDVPARPPARPGA